MNTQKKDTKIYHLGSVTGGSYEGADLYFLELPCDGMCGTQYFRFLKQEDNSLILLEALSDDYVIPEYKGIFGFSRDQESTITDLFPQKTLAIPNTKYTLVRSEQLFYPLIDDVEKNSCILFRYTWSGLLL